MFFDCTGLIAGLVASVITKWKANDKYSYGYVRAEILAGFVNGLFLLFISFFLMSEAVERAIEPPEVNFYQTQLKICLIVIIFLLGKTREIIHSVGLGVVSKFSWYLCIPTWAWTLPRRRFLP